MTPSQIRVHKEHAAQPNVRDTELGFDKKISV